MTKIVIISDTHEHHNEISLPEGDILIHCGDYTNKGNFVAVEDFLNWFSSQPHKYKIFIEGNHELKSDYKSLFRSKYVEIINKFLSNNKDLYHLDNSWVEIEGFKIWGSAATPFFYNWAHNYQRGEEIAKVWSKIPDDTEILITHGPPYGILDEVDLHPGENRDVHQGCEELLKRVNQLEKIRLIAAGHLHKNGSQTLIKDNIIFANAAICTEQYEPTNKPIVIELENKE